VRYDLDVDLARRTGFRLEVAWSGETDALALVGPSGSGKTTLLDLLAGVETGGRGSVRLDGAEQRGVPLHRRRVGYVTQDALLFPHLSVAENLRYGRHAGPLDEVVDALHLRPLLDRRPRRLSGGERRRVALARALVSRPRLLLLDEPFAGLDAQRRRDALSLLRLVRARFGTPLVVVSHVPEEIVGLADTALRLEDGRLVAHGPAASVLRAGETRVDNHLTGRVVEGTRVEVDGVELVADVPPGVTGAVRLACFAHDVLLATEPPRGLSARNVVPTRVLRLEALGDSVLVHLERPRLLATLTPHAVRELALREGAPVHAVLKATSVSLLGPA